MCSLPIFIQPIQCMRQANLDEIDIGVRMGGRKINNLRYADDTTLLAESKEDIFYSW